MYFIRHLYLEKKKNAKKVVSGSDWISCICINCLLCLFTEMCLSIGHMTPESSTWTGMHKYSVDENIIMLLGRNDSFSITSTTQMCTCTLCKPKLLIPLAAFFILTSYFHEDREVWIRHLISSLWSFLLCFSAVSLLITSIHSQSGWFLLTPWPGCSISNEISTRPRICLSNLCSCLWRVSLLGLQRTHKFTHCPNGFEKWYSVVNLGIACLLC